MAAEGGMPAYGYIKPKSGRQTVAGNDGTGISETEDWIETFPNGVFAFKDNAVYLKEGEKKEKKLMVNRLGGRDGGGNCPYRPDTCCGRDGGRWRRIKHRERSELETM